MGATATARRPKRAVEDCDSHYSGVSSLFKQSLLNPLAGSKQKVCFCFVCLFVFVCLFLFVCLFACVRYDCHSALHCTVH